MSGVLRTIADLLGEANQSDSARARATLLAQASAQASAHEDWEAIFLGIPDGTPRESLEGLVRGALLSALSRREVWGYRNAAVFQAQTLKDAAGARDTLLLGERMLETVTDASPVFGFEWGVLANGFKTALFDEAEARRCLNRGWDLAWSRKDVEQLGRLVNQWSAILNRTEAVERLSSVEEAARTWGCLGDLVYWWRALGDARASLRVRAEALATATRFEQALALARFWRLHEEDSPGIEKAFEKAASLATNAEEWFAVAEACMGHRECALLQRSALDRAAALPAGDALKVQIASSYFDWYGDEVAADRVGPRGLRPAQLHSSHVRLEGWEASPSALFDWLRVRMTPAHVALIAGADYGDSIEKHSAALVAIFERGIVPVRMAWHPGEVVELTRWSTGDRVDHAARAMCCVLLCLASNDDDLSSTGPILVESCIALGGEARTHAESLLVWRYETREPGTPEAATALFLLFILRAASAPEEERLLALLETLAKIPDAHALPQWMAESLRADLWSRLVETYVAPLRGEPLALALASIGIETNWP